MKVDHEAENKHGYKQFLYNVAVLQYFFKSISVVINDIFSIQTFKKGLSCQ